MNKYHVKGLIVGIIFSAIWVYQKLHSRCLGEINGEQVYLECYRAFSGQFLIQIIGVVLLILILGYILGYIYSISGRTLKGGLIGLLIWILLLAVTPSSSYAGTAGPLFALPICILMGLTLGFLYKKIKG